MNEGIASAIDNLLRVVSLEAIKVVMWGAMLLVVATWHALAFRWLRR